MVSRVIPRVAMHWGGVHMPGIGFGTYLSKKGELIEGLQCALDVGYRHIDTAISYDNDEDIGKVLEPLFRHDTIERKDVFLTTKIPPIFMAPKDVEKSVTQTLERLQTYYLDLLLIHTPFGIENVGVIDGEFKPRDKDGNVLLADYDYVKTWKAMEKLVRKGVVRQIGLSNFSQNQIEDILRKGKIKPSNLQHECHAYLQQGNLRRFCTEHQIVNTGYSPMGAPQRPDYYQRNDQPTLLEDPVVTGIAQKLGKTPGQILIRYISQLGVVPLPKSVKPKRVIENFEAMFFDIPDAEMKQLEQLDRNTKFFTFDWAKTHPKFPTGDY